MSKHRLLRLTKEILPPHASTIGTAFRQPALQCETIVCTGDRFLIHGRSRNFATTLIGGDVHASVRQMDNRFDLRCTCAASRGNAGNWQPGPGFGHNSIQLRISVRNRPAYKLSERDLADFDRATRDDPAMGFSSAVGCTQPRSRRLQLENSRRISGCDCRPPTARRHVHLWLYTLLGYHAGM